jgi:hypothetical protein
LEGRSACGENLQKLETGCYDQDIMKHESDMQQKVFFLYVMGGAARELWIVLVLHI